MFRKIAAGTSAAVVAAGLAAAPAVAAGMPVPAGDCVDVVPTETAGVDQPTGDGFVFGPLSEVPHFLTGERSCFVASAPAPGQDADSRRADRRHPSRRHVRAAARRVRAASGGTAGRAAVRPRDASGGHPGAGPARAPPAPPAPRESGREANNVLPEAQPRLPQTAADTRPLATAGGGSLIAAGLAWIGGARRRKRR
jgi:LPXTG-motif cell wall-anchored protein